MSQRICRYAQNRALKAIPLKQTVQHVMFLMYCLCINLSMGCIVRISTNMDKSRPKLAKNVGKNMKMLVPGPVGPQYALFCYGSPHHRFPWVKIHTWRIKLSQYVCFSPKNHKETSKSVKKRQKASKCSFQGPLVRDPAIFLYF